MSDSLSWGTVFTALTAVGAVVVGSWLNSSQSGHAKLWDLRREAYGTILSQLSSIETIVNVADEYISEDLYAYFEGDASTMHSERIAEHMKIVSDKYAGDYLILSDQFIALFEKMSSDMDAGPDAITPDAHDIFAAAVRKYRPLLLAQGRSEIMIGLPWYHRLRPWAWTATQWQRSSAPTVPPISSGLNNRDAIYTSS